MENITINQKQLFDVIKRTMSLSKEYVIEKLDDNTICFIIAIVVVAFTSICSIITYNIILS